MKKLIAILLSIVLLCSLTGCLRLSTNVKDNTTEQDIQAVNYTWDDIWSMELYDGAFDLILKTEFNDQVLNGLNKLIAYCEGYDQKVKIVSFGISDVNDNEVFMFAVPEYCSDVIDYFQNNTDVTDYLQSAYLTYNINNNEITSSLESYIASYAWYKDLKNEIETEVTDVFVVSGYLWNQEKVSNRVNHDLTDWEWVLDNADDIFFTWNDNTMSKTSIYVIAKPNLSEKEIISVSNEIEPIAAKYHLENDNAVTENAMVSLIVPADIYVQKDLISQSRPFVFNIYSNDDAYTIVKCV